MSNLFTEAHPRAINGPYNYVSTMEWHEPHQMEVECENCGQAWYADVAIDLSKYAHPYHLSPSEARDLFATLSEKPGHEPKHCIQFLAAVARGEAELPTQPVETEDW